MNIASLSTPSVEGGNATADKILKDYSAYVNGSLINGTMENRKTFNWKPKSATTYNLLPGYYSGGVLDSTDAYNAGKNDNICTGSYTQEKAGNEEYTVNCKFEPRYVFVICSNLISGNKGLRVSYYNYNFIDISRNYNSTTN